MSARGEKSESQQPSFEQRLAALEQAVTDLEEGKIGLAEALARYEEAVGLLKDCYQLLERAERKIELLGRVDESGAATTAPLEDAAESLSEKAERRTKRRRATPTDDDASGDVDSPRGLF